MHLIKKNETLANMVRGLHFDGKT
jgi:hypothetical protein